jgi:hypothetical protein
VSFWIEIHCDAPMKGLPVRDARINDRDCASFNNDNPGSMGAQVMATKKAVIADALASKWTRRSFGWCCPSCTRKLYG